MKTAEQWLKQLSLSGTASAIMNDIHRIQADALASAADICIRQHANADGEDCAKLIIAECDKLEAE